MIVGVYRKISRKSFRKVTTYMNVNLLGNPPFSSAVHACRISALRYGFAKKSAPVNLTITGKVKIVVDFAGKYCPPVEPVPTTVEGIVASLVSPFVPGSPLFANALAFGWRDA